MSLQTRLATLINAIGADIKAIFNQSSLTAVTDIDGTETLPCVQVTPKKTTVQKILDWMLARANTWSANQTFYVTETTAYDPAATDGQVGVGSTIYIRQGTASNIAFSQLVFLARNGFGFNRIVNSGGSAPFMAFCTNNEEHLRVSSQGVVSFYQPAIVSKSAAATLTTAEMRAGILNTTGTTYTVTAPTGAQLESVNSTPAVDMAFDFTIINSASGTITLGANGNTTLGGLTVAPGSSATFRFRKTAANFYTIYRVG